METLSEILKLSYPIHEVSLYFWFTVGISDPGSGPTSSNAGNVMGESGVIENIEQSVGISMIAHLVCETKCTFSIQSVILNSGNLSMSRNIRIVTGGQT